MAFLTSAAYVVAEDADTHVVFVFRPKVRPRGGANVMLYFERLDLWVEASPEGGTEIHILQHERMIPHGVWDHDARHMMKVQWQCLEDYVNTGDVKYVEQLLAARTEYSREKIAVMVACMVTILAVFIGAATALVAGSLAGVFKGRVGLVLAFLLLGVVLGALSGGILGRVLSRLVRAHYREGKSRQRSGPTV